GEPPIGRATRSGPETGERLDADRLATKRANRLEDHLEHAFRVERSADPLLLPLLLLQGLSLDRELPDERLDDVPGDLDGEGRLPGRRLLDRFQDRTDRAALEQIPDRTGFEHLQDRRPVMMRGERDHLGLRRAVPDLTRGMQPAARHAHVDEGNVRALAVRGLDGARRIANCSYQLQPSLRPE